MDILSLTDTIFNIPYIELPVASTGLGKFFRRYSTPSQGPSDFEIFYHGTKRRETATTIFDTGLWMVGDSQPLGIYLGSSFEIAADYMGSAGAIILVQVNRRIPLAEKYKGAFYYPTPNAIPFKEFYMVNGMRPVAVVNARGDRIR